MSMNVSAVYIEITNLCNLNCATCYNRSGLNKTRQELSKCDITKLIERLKKYGCRRIILAGGEPTIHSRFDSILSLADEYPELSFGISTNGMICSEKQLTLYRNNGMFTVQVSVDGSCEEVALKTRGKGSFSRAEKTVRVLTAANPQKCVTVKTVLSQRNIADTEAFYRWAVEVGAQPEYAFINKIGNGSDGWDNKGLSAKQKLLALRIIDSLNREYGIEAQLPVCTSGCPYNSENGDISLLVKPDGGIYPCQSLYDKRYELLNLAEFDDTLFERRLSDIRALTQKREHIDYGCERCILKHACHHGCIANAQNYSGDPIGNDGECDYRKLQFVGFEVPQNLKK